MTNSSIPRRVGHVQKHLCRDDAGIICMIRYSDSACPRVSFVEAAFSQLSAVM